MSGHSKWATIKHKKGAADAKRGKIFSKIAKEITIVVKQGGGDPGNNPTLRTLIAKAKSVNMPNDNIDRAIKKGTGELAADILEEIIYEGYTNSVGVVVKVLTDNKNRAAAEVRSIFKKAGAELAQQGSVMRNFARKGTILIPQAEGLEEDAVMEVVLNAGADDMETDDGGFTVTCEPSAYYDVCNALDQAKIVIDAENSQVGLVPLMTTPVSDVSVAKAINRLVEALEENEDVEDVYTNMDVDDSIADQLDAE